MSTQCPAYRTLAGPAAAIVVIVAVAWYAGITLQGRAAGVIGNDPATYAQMAIDLAERGTPARAFPLLDALRDEGLSWYAFIPVGYRLPDGRPLAVPVFAFGAPLLLAVAWRLAGEGGLYALTPLVGAASLVVVFVLARRLLAGAAHAQRAVIAALAVVLLATTPKQIALALAPMSDVPAQFASALAVLLALIAEGRRPWPARLAWLAAGLMVGLAYLIRHSTLLILIPIAWLAWSQPARRWRREGPVWLAAGLAVMMAPDLAYRAAHLEHVLAVESLESTVASWRYVLPNLLNMAFDLASWRGFGPLVVLAGLGVGGVWRRAGRRAAIALLGWGLAFALFHAPLALTAVFENTLRYLLPAYPPLVICMAAGCVALGERIVAALRRARGAELARQSSGRALRLWRALLGVGGAVLLAGGLAFAVRALVKPPDPQFTYGRIGTTARADLAHLAGALPADAVIGTSDQMLGALLLYTQRDIFRPFAFVSPSDQFPRFLAAMRQRGRPVFVLGNLSCLAGQPDDARLPAWLADYAWRETGLVVRGLPFDCEQRVYQAAD